CLFFFFSSRRRHTRCLSDWSSDVCSSDLVRPKTGEHDVDTKINQARKFLEHKDKVLVYVLFKGRELQHIEEGRRIINGILEKLRSEERRVGKECRARSGRDEEKKEKTSK